MPKDELYEYARSVYGSWSEKHTRIAAVYDTSRMRITPITGVMGRKIQTAPTGRALSLVNQFRAMSETTPRVEVVPKDNSEEEDKRTGRLEQWFKGVPRAISRVGMHPYSAFVHNAAESGVGILITEFDEARALAGKFPLRVRAPSPFNFACAMGADEIECAVWKEEKQTLGLLTELNRLHEAAHKADWDIPTQLRRDAELNPNSTVEVTHYWDADHYCFWIQEERVWTRPNLLARVPVDLAFLMDVPSDKPEEWGMGIIWPVLEMIINEQMVLDRAHTGFEFFTFPMARIIYTSGKVDFIQARPGLANIPNVASVEIVPVYANYQALDILLNTYNRAIGRLTLPEVTFGEGAQTTSGYQVSLLQAAPMRRVEMFLNSLQQAWASHYSFLLQNVEYFANGDMARALGARKEDDIDKYLRSFATVYKQEDLTGVVGGGIKKQHSRVTLKSSDVEGYEDVVVNILPILPQDENAKWQRAKLAKEVGYSREGTLRDILEVPRPDQELQWQKDDMMLSDPMWAEFMLRLAQKEKLNREEKLYAEWQEFIKAKSEQQAAEAAQQQQQQVLPAGASVVPQVPSPIPQQMIPGGALPGPAMGVPPEMMPPQMAGAVPLTPEEMAAQQMMQQLGGGGMA